MLRDATNLARVERALPSASSGQALPAAFDVDFDLSSVMTAAPPWTSGASAPR
jgi:hypothetical protein